MSNERIAISTSAPESTTDRYFDLEVQDITSKDEVASPADIYACCCCCCG